ncbi:phage tail protein [Nesterenkonia sp. PF2B19]|uniref:phage tail protein n=1 Tax=Nesterenkonia sp. PF2B19 TaxID=1881858 RepID=UPI0008722C98|nr:phage tail tape measure protein [Nesterenkonia sp. PF2B19]
MASLADLMVRVGVDDQLSSGIESAVDSVERNLGRIGIGAAAGGAALEGFARGQADATGSLRRTSIATGETEDSLRDLAHGMSDHTFAAADAADGMDLLTQKGITTREGFEEILPAVDTLADATGMELTDSIEAADKMLAPFGDDLNDVGENSDQMARLITQTDVPLATLERNLGRVPDELQGLGFGLDDAAAGIEHFRDQGYTGQEAVREFRRSVADSEGDMDAFLDTLGLTAEEWDEYGEAVEPMPGLAQEQADQMNDLMTPMEKLQQNVENLMFKYGGLAEAAGMLAMPMMALGPLLKGILTVVPLLAKGVVGLVTGIGAAATAIWAKVAALSAWVARMVVAAAQGVAAMITAAAQITARFLAMTAAAVASGVRIAAVWTAQIIASAVRGAAAMAAAAARVVAGWVLMGVQSMIHAARMAAAWLVAMGPIGWIIAAVVGLVALIIANWDKVSAWTAKAWDAVVTFVVDAWNNIVDWVTDAASNAADFVRDGWETAKRWTSDIWDGIVDWISSIPERIVQGLIALAQLYVQFGEWILSVKDAAVEKFVELLDYVKGIPGDIVANLGDLGSLLFEGGQNIIQGLIDGIKNMVGGVGDAISGAVDVVKDFLPWSPAKEGPLRDNPPELGGNNITKMLSEGIADGEDDVVAEAERIAAAAAIQAPDVEGPRVPSAARVDPADSGPGGQGSGGGLTLNVDMRGARLDSDDRVKQLSQDLNTRIQRADRSRGRVSLEGATR